MTTTPDTDTVIGVAGTTIRIFTVFTIQGDVGIGTDAGVEIVSFGTAGDDRGSG